MRMKMKLFVATALVVIMGCAIDELHVKRALVSPALAPGAEMTFGTYMVGHPFYGGMVQGAAFLTQEVAEVPDAVLTEQITKDWETMTKGGCPLPQQLTEVKNKWREYERTLKLQGKKITLVKEIGYGAFRLNAPALDVMCCLIRSAAIAGGPIGAASLLRPTRIDVSQTGASASGGTGGEGGIANATGGQGGAGGIGYGGDAKAKAYGGDATANAKTNTEVDVNVKNRLNAEANITQGGGGDCP